MEINKGNFIDTRKNSIHDFFDGSRQSLPIALGYFPVSFTFGLMAVNGGIPVWIVILISMTNLTSAGQFAGTNLIIAGAGYVEITVTTFVINIRYMLMSLSLSQKIAQGVSNAKRWIMSFGITDETFTVAAMQKKDITFAFMLGLEILPYMGWALGTAAGAVVCTLLPETLQNSMGIALYAMFIALVIPAAKKSKAALAVSACAIFISSLLRWIPVFSVISGGWRIIIATLIACTLGAKFFPMEDVVNAG
ncbi:4-azaleucine resistance transporter AzlC [Ruminiclostridium sufflavum DSM 19573]|uniref:4-azaleucine resistance transporter AzlC n=1 Tax=Ruminiclostridium sufflavum DSM 19573 TaxID=1121337 RepID=A0A318XJ40_9FIRM|nr:AzlC family ABC transporter permease [Ruminiclostridium sufflavum]PYG87255.1 4-azaleucine resistance transporter AzlC [Ruminiclostridium sufflavum DSM 19573]